MTSRKKASAAQVVADIFGASSDRDPRPKEKAARISRPPDGSRGRLLLFLAVIAFLFGGGVILSGRIFGEASRKAGVVLTLDGSQTAAPGDKLELTARITNQEEDRIEDATLFIRYPEKFKFLGAEPKPVEGALGKWSLGTLDRGVESLVRFHGSLAGNVGEIEKFEVVIEYRRPGFALLHSVEANYVVRLETAGLEFGLTSPGESRPGEPFAFKVTLVSTEGDMAKLELVLESTPGLKILDLKPGPETKPATYTIKKLSKGKPKIIEGRASRTVTGEAGRLKAILKKVVEAKAPSIILAERTLELSGLGPPATLDISATSLQSGPMTLGSKVAVTATAHAANDSGLKEARISLFLMGNTLELSHLSSDPQTETPLSKEPWTPPPGPEGGPAASFSLGDIIEKSERGVTFIFTLPITAPSVGGKNIPNLYLEAFALLEAKLDGQPVTVRTNRLPIKLSTLINLEASVEVKEGAHDLLWILQNGSNSVRDLMLTTTLGDGVTIESGPRSSLGDEVRYEASSRKLVWNIPWLPAYAGSSGTPITLQATLRRDPTLPSSAALAGSTTLTARDDFTGLNISTQIDPILSPE